MQTSSSRSGLRRVLWIAGLTLASAAQAASRSCPLRPTPPRPAAPGGLVNLGALDRASAAQRAAENAEARVWGSLGRERLPPPPPRLSSPSRPAPIPQTGPSPEAKPDPRSGTEPEAPARAAAPGTLPEGTVVVFAGTGSVVIVRCDGPLGLGTDPACQEVLARAPASKDPVAAPGATPAAPADQDPAPVPGTPPPAAAPEATPPAADPGTGATTARAQAEEIRGRLETLERARAALAPARAELEGKRARIRTAQRAQPAPEPWIGYQLEVLARDLEIQIGLLGTLDAALAARATTWRSWASGGGSAAREGAGEEGLAIRELVQRIQGALAKARAPVPPGPQAPQGSGQTFAPRSRLEETRARLFQIVDRALATAVGAPAT